MIGFEDFITKQKRILHELREEFSVKKKELDIVEASIVEGRINKTLLEEDKKILQKDIYSLQNTLKIETKSLEDLQNRSLKQNFEKKQLVESIETNSIRKSVLQDSIKDLLEEGIEIKSNNKELHDKNILLVKYIQEKTQILDNLTSDIEKKNNIFKKREKELELRELLVEQREKQAQANESLISDTLESIKHL